MFRLDCPCRWHHSPKERDLGAPSQASQQGFCAEKWGPWVLRGRELPVRTDGQKTGWDGAPESGACCSPLLPLVAGGWAPLWVQQHSGRPLTASVSCSARRGEERYVLRVTEEFGAVL